jgi:hypothetical protein
VPDQDDLQFHRAEPAEPQAALACAACGRSISDRYYEVNGQVVCGSCRGRLEDEWERGGAAGRFTKALGLGILATIGCSVLWYGVLKLTDAQWGILAIVVGFVVGGAVRKGSNGRGGWRYQTLAIFLTYTAIVSSYVPFILEGLRQESAQVSEQSSAKLDATVKADAEAAPAAEPPGAVAIVIGLVALLALLYATPFLAGLENAIGILIIGFALYEAWKLNKKVELRITGPYQVAGGAAPA